MWSPVSDSDDRAALLGPSAVPTPAGHQSPGSLVEGIDSGFQAAAPGSEIPCFSTLPLSSWVIPVISQDKMMTPRLLSRL